MTAYEQGFLSKCAEYEVPSHVSSYLLKLARGGGIDSIQRARMNRQMQNNRTSLQASQPPVAPQAPAPVAPQALTPVTPQASAPAAPQTPVPQAPAPAAPQQPPMGVGQRTMSAVGNAVGKVRDAADDFGRKAYDTASRVGHGVSNVYNQARNAADDFGRAVGQGIGQVASVPGRIGFWARRSSDRARRRFNSLRQLVGMARRPLPPGASYGVQDTTGGF